MINAAPFLELLIEFMTTSEARHSDWNDLKIFLAVARGGTHAFAAEVLGQSICTVGRRIRALEGSLGSSLFHRSARGLTLTHEGTAMLRNVEQMEIEALAVRRKLSGECEPSGLLRVSASGWLSSYLLAQQFAAFSSDNPRVQIQLLSSQSTQGLVRHKADLLYQLRQFDEPDFIQREVVRVGYAVYAQADYLEQAGPVPAGGRGHKLIALTGVVGDPGHDEWLEAHLDGARTTLHTDNPEALLHWCRSGVGLAVLPRAVGGRYSDLRVVATPFLPPERTVWAGYHRDLKYVPRLRALLDATLQAGPA